MSALPRPPWISSRKASRPSWWPMPWASRSKTSRKLALARLQKSGVDIVDSEMVLFEWMERAGTPEFKALQALVK